jgi:hypothetical protein
VPQKPQVCSVFMQCNNLYRSIHLEDNSAGAFCVQSNQVKGSTVDSEKDINTSELLIVSLESCDSCDKEWKYLNVILFCHFLQV